MRRPAVRPKLKQAAWDDGFRREVLRLRPNPKAIALARTYVASEMWSYPGWLPEKAA